MNFKNYMILYSLTIVFYLAGISTFRLEDHLALRLGNETRSSNNSSSLTNNKIENVNHHKKILDNKDAKILKNTSDQAVAATDHKLTGSLPVNQALRPRGFLLPKSRPVQQEQTEAHQPAAQNNYGNYFPNLPPLGHAQPFYSLTDDPFVGKFLLQHSKEFQPRQQPLTAYDASILGSGDFGILRGGTFYSGEEQSYNNEEGSDFYYGAASSNIHTASSTESFIQKYTYPEEQFAQFRDFADLGAPEDSAFSQYVVVYAAKNSTYDRSHSKPKNIFEQLQEIDKEKALEQKKLRKTQTNNSVTKLKLVRTKLVEKKWVQKQPPKLTDDDPLIALS